ncbi:MAG: DUF3352 domain-containing protein, partial [Gemmatimonadales bacterium]|nr:DUF3352 domain-containing protein [Gemmatimonadales bacterium]
LYQRALSHVGEASLTVFVNKRGTRGLMRAMGRAAAAAGEPGEAGPDADRMAQVVDRYNVQNAVVVGSHWTDAGLEVRSYTMLDPAAPGAAPLREMLSTPASEIEVVGYFPDSTLAFYAVNFLDAVKIFDFAVTYVKEVASAADTAGADAAARVDQGIAQFQQQTGMDIRTDILGWMGREAAFGLNGVVKGGFFPVPEASLVIQAADPARAQAFFRKLEAQIAAAAQSSPQLQGFPVQFQEEDHKGVKIRFAPTPMGEGLAPAYALQDDYAVVALSRTTLKRMLDARTGAAPGVSANAQFESLGGFLPGQANLVGYANTAALFTEIGSAVTTFQQMSGQQPGIQAQDSVLAALKNIEAVGTYGLNDGGGVEQRFLIRIK